MLYVLYVFIRALDDCTSCTKRPNDGRSLKRIDEITINEKKKKNNKSEKRQREAHLTKIRNSGIQILNPKVTENHIKSNQIKESKQVIKGNGRARDLNVVRHLLKPYCHG